jgi:hypothetical protein
VRWALGNTTGGQPIAQLAQRGDHQRFRLYGFLGDGCSFRLCTVTLTNV